MRRGVVGAASLIATALIAAACGGTQAIGTGASDLVPASAPVYIQIDTDPGSSQWQTVNDLAGRFPSKQKAVDTIKKELRQEGGLDWNDDVKPALGKELDFVWLDFRNGGTDAVALTQPSDDQKFAEVIKKGNAHDTSTQLVYEKFEGWEVISDSRSKIDRFEQESKNAQKTLADDSSFGHAVDKLGDAVVRAYVSGPPLMGEALNAAGPNGRPFIRKIGRLDWIGAGLGVNADGVRLDVIAHGAAGKLFKGIHIPTYTSQLTHTAPADTLAYLTFHGTPLLLGGLKSPVLGAPQFGSVRGILRQVGKLIQGENALYVRPAPSGRIPEVTLVTEPDPSVDGARTLDRLVRRYRGDLGVTPRRTTIAGLPARTLGFGEFSIRYADVGKNLVVSDLPRGIETVVNGGKTLAHSDTYRDAVDSARMPSKTQGYLYVNIHSTIPVVERLSHARVPSQVRRNLAPLRSALEYSVARSHEIEISFFLRIR